MSEAKHTPGPWVVYPETDGSEICAVDYVEKLPIRQRISTVTHGNNWIFNARLIAAAPEMLATLRKLEYWLDTDPEVIEAMPGDERRDHMAKLGMIREVITKAEGRS